LGLFGVFKLLSLLITLNYQPSRARYTRNRANAAFSSATRCCTAGDIFVILFQFSCFSASDNIMFSGTVTGYPSTQDDIVLIYLFPDFVTQIFIKS
jgi:hypothetical protein